MDLAFTIVVHRDILQIARLLRMIHRVNNYYCIHLDNRSSQIFQDAIDGLTKCFGNNVQVVPQSKRVSVIWGDESVLIPQFICGEQALNSHPTWKYLINLVGQEFPLKTNLEIIAAMKALNGSNLVESFNMTRFKSWINDDKLSLNATFYKGTLYGAYRRDFLEAAILGSHVEPIRRQILMHRKYLHPDELFFPSLAYNSHLGLPGACLRAPALPSEVNLNHPAKFVIWGDYNVPCRTKYVRAVCILGNDHVEWLKSVQHLFANKFYQEYHPQAYDDLEQWYFSKVRAEISTGRHDPNLNLTLYANRTCSRFHL